MDKTFNVMNELMILVQVILGNNYDNPFSIFSHKSRFDIHFGKVGKTMLAYQFALFSELYRLFFRLWKGIFGNV